MRWFKKNGSDLPAKPEDESRRIYFPRLWPYRLLGNFIILMAIGFGCLGFIIVKSNFVPQKLNSLSDYFYRATTYLGFTVDDILIYGRNKTSLDEINNIVNTGYGDNILHIDIHQLKDDLKQLPWVKEVTVERSYMPNILKINLKEKQVGSLWQFNRKFFPIDTDGQIINTEYLPGHPLLLIVGKNAPGHINDLLEIIEQDAALFRRIKAANFISGRRWDILLDDMENGITVKLPQNDTDAAWKKLIKLNKTRGILKRKLTIIDLRFEDKILVKPRKITEGEKLKPEQNKGNSI